MNDEIKKPSDPLQELEEAVVRYLKRRPDVELHDDSAWGYQIASADPDVDEIVMQLLEVLSAQRKTSSPFPHQCLAEAERTTRALDRLLPQLGPVLETVERCALVKFRPGSRFEPPLLKPIQRLAPRIDQLTSKVAEVRLLLIDLIKMLRWFETSAAKLGISDREAATLYAYRLKKAGVAPEVIAEVVGRFDEISPRASTLERADEQDREIRNLEQQLNRFAKKLRK